MSNRPFDEPAHAGEVAAGSQAAQHHHHRGKSSESLLDKAAILGALEIRTGQTILDAGCGDGYMSRAFAGAMHNTGVVYALDPDETAIAALRNESGGGIIHAIVGDITTTTLLADASVDLIYLATVVHGFAPSQMNGFRNEVVRILKPRGKLAIVEIDKRPTPFGPPLDIRFSPEELRRCLPLTPVTVVRAGEYFFMQILEKPA